MSWLDFVADVITLPITVPLKVIEAVPEVVEKCIKNVEHSIDEVGLK